MTLWGKPMPTVFEVAVIKLTKAAREIARDDNRFNAVTYDGFVRVMWTENTTGQMYGLPAEVFVRALKEAYREFTGRQPIGSGESV